MEARETEESETRKRLAENMHISVPTRRSTLNQSKPTTSADGDPDDVIRRHLPAKFGARDRLTEKCKYHEKKKFPPLLRS